MAPGRPAVQTSPWPSAELGLRLRSPDSHTMADEDKEKAEKIAAAKKRFEELKKQKAKEGGKASDGAEAKPKKKATKKKAAAKDSKDKDKKDDDNDAADDNDDDDDTAEPSAEGAGQAAAKLESLELEVSELKQSQADAEAKIQDLEAKLKASEDKEKSLSQQVEELHNKSQKRIAAGGRKSVDGDSGGLEELEDEERRQLQARVHELETEVYELRKGAWTGQQPGGPADGGDGSTAARSPGAFSDVDLSQGPYSAKSRRQSSGVGQAFALQNVINAFTGQPGVAPPSQHRRGPSKGDGLLDEDDDLEFDEDAFRKAQEEEAKARLERVREVKRGLSGWKGWKVDLVDVRGGAEAGVFDI